MQITVAYAETDIVAAQRVAGAELGRRFPRTTPWAALTVLPWMFAGAFLMCLADGPWHGADTAWRVLLAALAFGMPASAWLRGVYGARLAASAQVAAEGPFPVEVSYRIADDGLHWHSDRSHGVAPWPAIEAVRDEAQHLVIVMPNAPIAIPAHRFASVDERTAFADALRRHLAAPAAA